MIVTIYQKIHDFSSTNMKQFWIVETVSCLKDIDVLIIQNNY